MGTREGPRPVWIMLGLRCHRGHRIPCEDQQWQPPHPVPTANDLLHSKPLTCGGSGGCTGSICELGYNYIQLFGHVTEEDYPYISGTTMDSEECMFDISTMKPVAGLTGYNTLPSNDQEAIMTALATVGPLAVGVDASKWSRYGGGVFEDTDFEANMGLNHAVVLIGYGTDEAEGDFWMIRN